MCIKSLSLSVALLFTASASFADQILFAGNQRPGITEILVNGAAGGVGEEIFNYFVQSGTPTQPGAPLFIVEPISAGRRDVPAVVYTFSFSMMPREMQEMNLQANLSPLFPGDRSVGMPGMKPGQAYAYLTPTDKASAVLYDLMKHAGVSPQPGDLSKSLVGQFIVCSPFHGSPQGHPAFHPTCRLILK